MKILLFFSFFAFSITSFANTPIEQYTEKADNVIRCDSTIEYNSDGKRRIKMVYTYNRQGNVTSKTRYYWDKGRWNSGYKTEYNLDEQGYCVSEKETDIRTDCLTLENAAIIDSTIVSIDSSSVEKRTEDNTPREKPEYDTIYDDRGRICTITTTISGKVERKTEFSYDDQGYLLCKMNYRLSKGELVPSWKDEYVYDSQGNLISRLHYSRSQGSTISCSTDENGDNVRTERRWIGDMKLQSTTHFYFSKHAITLPDTSFVCGTMYDPYENGVKKMTKRGI